MLPAKLTETLSDEQLTNHRQHIMIEVEAMLSSHYQTTTSDEVKYKILLNWVNMLQDFTAKEIAEACREQMKEEPRRKPNEGMIYSRIQNSRKRQLASMPQNYNVDNYRIRKNPDAEKRKKLCDELLGKPIFEDLLNKVHIKKIGSING
jgi:hypothetical protein|tara:strand:- start:5483 stop:5929 length:447 start_codon:yes stop_codon:yes gene_type:complete